MKCFYHKMDLDGQCSGAIVKSCFSYCEMFGMDYGDPFPWEKIVDEETVWMVDFSLQPFEDMIRLNEKAWLTWIDHHKTSVENAAQHNFMAKGRQILNVDLAACELTWDLCYRSKRPKAVTLLGRYDVWKFAETPHALEFQYGMRLCDTSPENYEFWAGMFYQPGKVAKAIRDGQIVLRYQKQQNAKVCATCAFEATLDGLRFVVVNAPLASSLLFDSVYDPKRHDGMMGVYLKRPEQWVVSLYSTKPEVDVSAICKRYGGGGHPGAAGFSTPRILWGPKKVDIG